LGRGIDAAELANRSRLHVVHLLRRAGGAERYVGLNKPLVNIKVIGVGGGGCNTLRLLAANPTPGVEHLACNTHGRSSDRSLDKFTFLEIGQSVRIPWPSGEFKIESGRLRAECPWFLRELKHHLKGAELVIMTIGMGGVTGTGGSPVIARVVKEMGIPLLAVVNTPYSFEGAHRYQCAAKGIQDLKPYVDNIIVVPCDFALRSIAKNAPISEALSLIDEIMVQAIASLTKLINAPNEINVKLADVCRIFRIPGQSTVAFGFGTHPEHPALDAAEKAIGNTVQPVDLARARGGVVIFSGGYDIATSDYVEALDFITGKLHPGVDPKSALAFGIEVDRSLGNTVKVTLVVTGTERRETPRILKLVKEHLDGKKDQ
jgi:cell division protein FtsZ